MRQFVKDEFYAYLQCGILAHIGRTISQYYVNEAVKQGIGRKQSQAGSVTFMQRFGSAINGNLHYHFVFLEGVYVARAEQGLKPRFVKVEVPTEHDIGEAVSKISRRVIRKLRDAVTPIPHASGA